MNKSSDFALEVFRTTGEDEHNLTDPDVAHLLVHENDVISSHELPGLHVSVESGKDEVVMDFSVDAGIIIKKPVHLCFGVMPESGKQQIRMKVNIGDGAKVAVKSHCTFPFAVDILHLMDAEITVGENAEYYYFERHIHSDQGGVTVVPKAKVILKDHARFNTEFELLKGRVGKIDITYETECGAHSVMEMKARISGSGDDEIKINEIGHLKGEHSRGVLTSLIALKDNASAEIYNKLTATAAYARGHVDCKEIIRGNGKAAAIPVVEVNHPLAHITHEAAIGSVNTRQLETLMSRGLNEDDASDLIIQGMLS